MGNDHGEHQNSGLRWARPFNILQVKRENEQIAPVNPPYKDVYGDQNVG